MVISNFVVMSVQGNAATKRMKTRMLLKIIFLSFLISKITKKERCSGLRCSLWKTLFMKLVMKSDSAQRTPDGMKVVGFGGGSGFASIFAFGGRPRRFLTPFWFPFNSERGLPFCASTLNFFFTFSRSSAELRMRLIWSLKRYWNQGREAFEVLLIWTRTSRIRWTRRAGTRAWRWARRWGGIW